MAQNHVFNGRKRVRKFFGNITEVAEMPNLIEVQKQSYDQFLMVDEPEGGRGDEGLQAVFTSVFPIQSFSGNAALHFVEYRLGEVPFDVLGDQAWGLVLQVFEQGVGSRAVDLNLAHHGERHAVVKLAKLLDFVIAARVLLAKLVAGKADYGNPLVLVLFVQLFQASELGGKTAF